MGLSCNFFGPRANPPIVRTRSLMIENQLTTAKKREYFRWQQVVVPAPSELKNSDPEDHFRKEQRHRQLMYCEPISQLRYEFPYAKVEHCPYERPSQEQRD
jgi:hypothetical protein